MATMLDSFIIYAIIFRLAIIGAGFGCVVMGYRLFVLGVMPQNGSDINVQHGETRLTVKNAAPGTCFAVVGLLMIVAMLIQGNPELKTVYERSVQKVRDTGQDIAMQENSHEIMVTEKTTVTTRGSSEDIFTAIERGKQFEQRGQLGEAIKNYAKPLENNELPLKDAVEPLRAIAAAFLKQEHFGEAIAYASLACQIDPENAEGLALIGRIEFHRGKYDKAGKAICRAAKIDPDFTSECDEMEKTIKDLTN